MVLKYCTYLTIYSGDKLPAFYIGSTSIGKIKNKYHGSVKSKKYGLIWNQELKDNPHLFKTIILEKFYSRKNATYNERLLQIKFDVVRSDQFVNMAIAKPNGFFGMDCSGKNSPVYGRKASKVNKSKISLTKRGENHPQYGKRGEDSINYGRKHSEITNKSKGRSGNENAMFNYKWSNEQLKERSIKVKFEETQKRENNGNAKPIIILGKNFGCIIDAAEHHNLTRNQIRKILHNKIENNEQEIELFKIKVRSRKPRVQISN